MPLRLTRESARRAGACYSDKEIAKLVPPEGLSVREVDALNISVNDKLWALIVGTAGMDDNVLRAFTAWGARELIKRLEEPDYRAINACAAAEKFASGQLSLEELGVAYWGARDAMEDSRAPISHAYYAASVASDRHVVSVNHYAVVVDYLGCLEANPFTKLLEMLDGIK